MIINDNSKGDNFTSRDLMGFIRWLHISKVNFTWFGGVLFGFLSKWFGGLEFVFSDLGSTGCILAFILDFGIDMSFTDGGAHVWKMPV